MIDRLYSIAQREESAMALLLRENYKRYYERIIIQTINK